MADSELTRLAHAQVPTLSIQPQEMSYGRRLMRVLFFNEGNYGSHIMGLARA
jgi:hypothetical protein